MNRESQIAIELQVLRSLCNPALAAGERTRLLDSLGRESFTEPEHQVVFESIRALLPRGPISLAELRVHLTRRGFPDTDVEKFFEAAEAANASSSPRKERTRS